MPKLDTIHPAARSALVLCVLVPVMAAVTTIAGAVLAAAGISGVDWTTVPTTALDAAGVALAGGAGSFAAMWVTPLTKRYGVGAGPDPVDIEERLS